MCGVYYLTDGLDVLYVGASRNVEARIRQHARNIDFSQVFVDQCEPEQFPALEAKAIREFNPHLNVANTTLRD
jgi:predicted GIY-YIG superfamily endonuclease